MVREIVKDVQEHHAGIIIMGSRGRGDLAGLVLGSTAHKVIAPGGGQGVALSVRILVTGGHPARSRSSWPGTVAVTPDSLYEAADTARERPAPAETLYGRRRPRTILPGRGTATTATPTLVTERGRLVGGERTRSRRSVLEQSLRSDLLEARRMGFSVALAVFGRMRNKVAAHMHGIQ